MKRGMERRGMKPQAARTRARHAVASPEDVSSVPVALAMP